MSHRGLPATQRKTMFKLTAFLALVPLGIALYDIFYGGKMLQLPVYALFSIMLALAIALHLWPKHKEPEPIVTVHEPEPEPERKGPRIRMAYFRSDIDPVQQANHVTDNLPQPKMSKPEPAPAPTEPYQQNGYTLYQQEVELKSGHNQTIYYFAKNPKNPSAQKIPLPEGYEVGENRKTKLPFLRKIKN